MRALATVRTFVLAVAVLFAASASAFAQITTGTIAGTVKDQQGGVIPGVTVILVSEAQGTKSSPVVTSSAGESPHRDLSPSRSMSTRSQPPAVPSVRQGDPGHQSRAPARHLDS